GSVGYVGVPHGVELNGEKLFYAHVHIRGGPAPVRRYLPELINLVWNGKINPGKVFDLASRSSGGGIPRYGRAPGHKDAAATVIGLCSWLRWRAVLTRRQDDDHMAERRTARDC